MNYFKNASNKTAFLTGAASGLGRAFALELAKQNWKLGICDIDDENLEETKKLASEFADEISTYHLDVSDPVAFEKISQEFLQEYKNIDLLINNAGIGASGIFEEISVESWQKVIGVNQMSVIYGCKNFIPALKKQKQGTIINIASAAAFTNLSVMGPYNASKAAVLALSETLYSELKSSNIHVSVVMPTFFKTNIMQHAEENYEGKKMGEMMVATSGLEPEYVAKKILKAASKNKFYIVLPFQARLVRLISRLFPGLFLRIKAFAFTKRELMQKRLEKKYKKLKK